MGERLKHIAGRVGLLLALVILTLAPPFLGRLTVARAATLAVCSSGCAYTRIQDAVNAATDGDTVQVGAGTYVETVTISKSLTLAGAGASQTVISGTGSIAPSLVTITGTATQVTISAVTLQGNFATNGGGLLNAGQPGLETTRLVNSVVSGNQATVGGGIADMGGDVQVISSTISGNAGLKAGGGIANSGGNTVTLTASTVANNASASVGGGIYAPLNGTLNLLTSTVYSNIASNGAGIYAQGGAVTLTATTIYSNTAHSAGGGLFLLNSPPVTVTDTILAGNHARTSGPDCSGFTLISGGYNLLGDGSACGGLSDGQNGDQVGTTANPRDPRLGPLQDNGGPTPTLALLPDSPAIYVVPSSLCAGSTDQRGFARPDPVAGNGHCSIGAVEYEAQPVTRLVAPGGVDSGDCTATPCQTIHYAIAQAAPVGDIISIAPGAYTETVTISKSLTLAGSGAAQTALVGAAVGASNVPPLVTIAGPSVSQVTVSGLTLRGNVVAAAAGGLLNAGRSGLETTRLVNSVVAGNSGIQGGGIDNMSGDLEVISSTISGNASVFGGGIANAVSNTVTLSDSTVANNSATTGGGLYTLPGGAVHLANSAVYSNSATTGGGIYAQGGAVTLTASTIYSNTARSAGGGLFLLNSPAVTVTDTILAGNHARTSGPDCSGGALVSRGFNLLGDAGACGGLTNGVNGDRTGTTAAPLNPRLGLLQDNGGPTPTLAPQAGSPAIDVIPAAACLGPTDERGFPRPDQTGSPCDIGADEGGPDVATTAPLPEARMGLNAVAGLDGRIFALGGDTPGGIFMPTTLSAVEAYSPTTNAWSAVAPMTTPRDTFGAAVGPDGRIFALGGNGHSTTLPTLNTVEAYSPVSNTWTMVAPLSFPRTELAAATGADGRIYAIGGWAGSTAPAPAIYNTVEAYDPISNTWTMVAPLPTARFDLAAVAGPDGRIYAIGGRNTLGATALNTVEAYDPVSNTWTTVAPLPTARYNLAAAVGSDGRIYAIGGLDGRNAQVLTTVEAYDPQTNTWASVAPLRTGRWGLAAAAGHDGRIYALGGHDYYLAANASDYLDTLEAYTPGTDTWTRSAAPLTQVGTPTSTATPIPPTATPTNTPVPPTATATGTNTPVPPTATATSTPIPPTSTPTDTPVPPTATSTPTSTSAPPTATSTPTNTAIPPMATSTPTNTPVPPTATPTSTATSAPTNTTAPPMATSTNTPVPPAATATSTPVPPTSTSTAIPATATSTPVRPTAVLTVSPRSVSPLQTFTLSGSGFGADEAISVYWDNASASATPGASPTTTTAGSFRATLTVPQAHAGIHTLRAVGRDWRARASVAVQVIPAVYLSPSSGKVGTAVSLVGVGFGAGETVAALWYPGLRVLGQAKSNGVGTVVLPFAAPASAPGTAYAIAYGLTTHLFAASSFGMAAPSHRAAALDVPARGWPARGGARYATVTWEGARVACRPAKGSRTRMTCVTTQLQRRVRITLPATGLQSRPPGGVTQQRLDAATRTLRRSSHALTRLGATVVRSNRLGL